MQKQPFADVLQNRYFLKFCNVFLDGLCKILNGEEMGHFLKEGYQYEGNWSIGEKKYS